MKPNRFVVSGCVSAALAILPAVSAAAATRECIVQKPTPASYTWNFKQETNEIFKDIQSDAAQARYYSARLQRIAWGPDSASWVTDADQFDQISAAVNDMGRKLCRLEAIRRVAAPWQQKTIDRIADGVTLLADNTQDALAFGGTHRKALWMPTFQMYVNNMYAQARELTRSVGYAVEYTKVDRQDRVLQKDLGVKSSS